MRVRTLFVVLLMSLGTPTLARATWSIVAVDQSSLEVGVAAASCIGGVDIVVGLVPGHGAVAAQAFANLDARDEATRLLAAGTPPSEVVERITSVDFDPEAWYSQWWSGMGIRQYGVVGLGGTPSAVSFTGELTVEWSGALQGEEVAVQGNMIRASVVASALRAFESTEGCALPDRLMIALEAGAEAGGDRRCSPSLGSLSAVLAVARPGDTPDRPHLRLSVDVDPGFGMLLSLYRLYRPYSPAAMESPTTRLRAEYDAWRAEHLDAPICTRR